jgi:hypothetical protein
MTYCANYVPNFNLSTSQQVGSLIDFQLDSINPNLVAKGNAWINNSYVPGNYYSSSIASVFPWGNDAFFTTASYIRIPNDDSFNFKQTDDFALSFWLGKYISIPTVQQIISKRTTGTGQYMRNNKVYTGDLNYNAGQYPFDIYFAGGYIYCTNSNGNAVTTLVGSFAQDFEKHVYDYYTYSDNNKKLLTAIACRFYNTRLRSLLIISINRIILRLFDINIQWLTFHEYNFVPFNENTPIRISYIFQGMLLNMTNIMINNMTPEPVYDIKLLTINDINNNYNTETECSICYNSLKQIDYASFECKHDYCVDCVTQLMFKKHNTCPHCRNNICVISCYNKENYEKEIFF